MKILLTNDDGYFAKGLLQLASALSNIHEVYICAPDGERSCSGHAITLWQSSLKVKEIDTFELTKGTKYQFSAPCIAISGTPADCTKFAIEGYFKNVNFDLVISGINTVLNVGTDAIYSGTFNSAQEGTLLGKKAIALSTVPHIDDYSFPVEFFVNNMDKLIEKIQPMTTLNINIPSTDKDRIKGVKCVPAGHRAYNDWYEYEIDGYQSKGYPLDCSNRLEDDDCKYSDLGYITISLMRVISPDSDINKLYDKVDFIL